MRGSCGTNNGFINLNLVKFQFFSTKHFVSKKIKNLPYLLVCGWVLDMMECFSFALHTHIHSYLSLHSPRHHSRYSVRQRNLPRIRIQYTLLNDKKFNKTENFKNILISFIVVQPRILKFNI